MAIRDLNEIEVEMVSGAYSLFNPYALTHPSVWSQVYTAAKTIFTNPQNIMGTVFSIFNLLIKGPLES